MKEIYYKELTYLNMHRFVIFLLFYFVVISCGTSPQRNRTIEDNQKESAIVETNEVVKKTQKNVDIPIAISLTHTEDEDIKQLIDAEYVVKIETNNDIYIDINSSYYKQYTSGVRFKTDQLAFFEKSETVENLTLCLDVVNNTSEKLSIRELDINVKESKPDTIPLIYICTTEEMSNSIYFVNESWFNWKGFTFSYTLLKNGESFNGYYKKMRHIPYFESYTIINLLPDMISMGYDYDGLIESLKMHYPHSIDHDNSDEDSDKCVEFSIMEEDENFFFFQNKFEPFGLKKNNCDEYVGSATLYGSILFDDSDFKVDFISEISLSTSAGFGALSYENDKFDVKLKSHTDEYILRYPYTTVIEPYGLEMIKLSVIADRSSTYKFQVDIKNDNGLNIKSKIIYFHNYNPKN